VSYVCRRSGHASRTVIYPPRAFHLHSQGVWHPLPFNYIDRQRMTRLEVDSTSYIFSCNLSKQFRISVISGKSAKKKLGNGRFVDVKYGSAPAYLADLCNVCTDERLYAQQAAEILSYREREPALPIARSWSLRPVPGMRFHLSSGQLHQRLSSITV